MGHDQPIGLPTNFKTLPEYLKTLGYKTHAFGKYVQNTFIISVNLFSTMAYISPTPNCSITLMFIFDQRFIRLEFVFYCPC